MKRLKQLKEHEKDEPATRKEMITICGGILLVVLGFGIIIYSMMTADVGKLPTRSAIVDSGINSFIGFERDMCYNPCITEGGKYYQGYNLSDYYFRLGAKTDSNVSCICEFTKLPS